MKKILVIIQIYGLCINTALAQSAIKLDYDGSGNRIRKVVTGNIPVPTLSASPSIVSTNQKSILSASGCIGGVYSWSTGHEAINSLSVYPCETKTYYVFCKIPTCPNVKSVKQITVQQLFPFTNNILTSEKSGNWNDPSVWCCGKTPTLNDLVIIYPKHQIVISDNTAKAKNLQMDAPMSELKYLAGGALQIKGN
jgi:hypothetical protein